MESSQYETALRELLDAKQFHEEEKTKHIIALNELDLKLVELRKANSLPLMQSEQVETFNTAKRD